MEASDDLKPQPFTDEDEKRLNKTIKDHSFHLETEDRTKCSRCLMIRAIADQTATIERLRDGLEDMANQFAYPSSTDKCFALTTGGLSALELAFDILGWTDPQPCPARECQYHACHKEATCGTPTKDGYKMLCGEHCHPREGGKLNDKDNQKRPISRSGENASYGC